MTPTLYHLTKDSGLFHVEALGKAIIIDDFSKDFEAVIRCFPEEEFSSNHLFCAVIDAADKVASHASKPHVVAPIELDHHTLLRQPRTQFVAPATAPFRILN